MDTRLKEFICKRTSLKDNEIRPELRLAEDIGFYGLDAISFFEEFFQEFKIKNPDDFDSDLHIDGGPDFQRRPLNWIKNLLNRDRRKYLRPDVTLAHLQKVIETGMWTNER